MAKCPECLIEFTPKENRKAHHCDCGSLLVLKDGQWVEHLPIHSDESTSEDRFGDAPPDWDVDEWIEADGEMKPVFRSKPQLRFEKKPPSVPLYRQPPRERVGKSGSDWRGDCGEPPSRRYLERMK
jgi:hypothetical protein